MKIGKFYTFFQLGKGPIMGPKISPGKSLDKKKKKKKKKKKYQQLLVRLGDNQKLIHTVSNDDSVTL